MGDKKRGTADTKISKNKAGRPFTGNKKKTFSLSKEAIEMLDIMAEEKKFSKSDVVDTLIRQLAYAELWQDRSYTGCARLILNFKKPVGRGKTNKFLFDKTKRTRFLK